MLSLRAHNIADYIVGVVLIIIPFITGLNDIPAARTVFLSLGISLIVYSLFTRYHYSIAKLIPLGLHMFLDCSIGVYLMASPWMFNYRDQISNGQLSLHFILGVGALALVAITRSRTDEQAIQHREMVDVGHRV